MYAQLALARFFMTSFIKQKSTMLFGVLAVALIVLSYSVSDINIAKKYKLFEDLVMLSQGFLLHLAAFFYTFEFLQKERSVGIFVLPLATQMSRRSYLFSVVLALFGMLILLGSLLIGIDLLMLFFIEDKVHFLVLWQLLLFIFSASLLVILMVLFSQFVSVMNSVIYAVIFYLLGNGLDELYYYAYYLKPQEWMQHIYCVIIYLIPNFSLFDKQGMIVNHAHYENFDLFFAPLIYWIIACMILFAIASLKFEKRALKVGQ